MFIGGRGLSKLFSAAADGEVWAIAILAVIGVLAIVGIVAKIKGSGDSDEDNSGQPPQA